MTQTVYTAITFAPVQGFIEKSRKLRDLYGSSYILSFLSWAICHAANQTDECEVISPALINVTQGMPNQIVIRGNFEQETARQTFQHAWSSIVTGCWRWIEQQFPEETYYWQRDWGLWEKYTWEFFWAQVEAENTTSPVREQISEVKRNRNWVGINWTGESSTLSGADAIAWPQLGHNNPCYSSYRQNQSDIERFYQGLSQRLGEAFIDPAEELSIPELIKRIVTHEEVASEVIETFRNPELPELTGAVQHVPAVHLSEGETQRLREIVEELNPNSFRDVNREQPYWRGWFLGDGDSAGRYLRQHSSPEELHAFSAQMREWGNAIRNPENSYLPGQGRMVYAGGDDFMGVLYEREGQIQPSTCLTWLSRFNRDFWQGGLLQPNSGSSFRHSANRPKPITVSVGFVWAGPNVPQRDVLQHCREAEQSAKRHGRDRIALRILFNGGNHLQWTCPWWLLEGDFSQANCPEPLSQADSRGLMAAYHASSWTPIYNDVALLEARHAFHGAQVDVALGLIEVYFGQPYRQLFGNRRNWWNRNDPETGSRTFSGILGDPQGYDPDFDGSDIALQRLNSQESVLRDFNAWVINLAKVGFHLNRSDSAQIAA